MVRKDKLLKFLKENNLTLYWTIIGEKQVVTPTFDSNDFVGVLQMSGFVALDGQGTIRIKEANKKFFGNYQ